jgi:hypothetical protein
LSPIKKHYIDIQADLSDTLDLLFDKSAQGRSLRRWVYVGYGKDTQHQRLHSMTKASSYAYNLIGFEMASDFLPA